MNLLGIYTVGVARSLCRRLLLDIVIVNKIVHSYDFVNHFNAMRPGNYQIPRINAKLGQFRRSRSLKVTDFGTN